MLFEEGGETVDLSAADLRRGLFTALEALEAAKPRRRVLLIPPDFTRFHSRAGELCQMAYEFYGERITDVLPALGTHHPITDEQRERMFGGIPATLFREHDWRNDVVTIGTVPAELVREASDGHVDEPWPAQLNRLVWEGGHDLVLSIGQVVPHEVMGMANYNKNLFIGTGGQEGINFSHFIGAVYGLERMMGRAENPLRKILNHASDHFVTGKLPVVYVHTVLGPPTNAERQANLAQGGGGDVRSLITRGLFIAGEPNPKVCFDKAAALSLRVNFNMLEAPLRKVVCFLDPDEFHSTWLGGKAIYRTRMAIADGGELVILAPGVSTFGEDARIDQLIRKYGYVTTPEVLALVKSSRDLMSNLSAAAHLMHASPENRFTITLCPGHLTREEVEGVGFQYADVHEMMARFDPTALAAGFNTIDGEEIFFVPNPAVGLWAYRGRFEQSPTATAAAGEAAEPGP